jgi:cytochrome c-type biogenesis protein CcmE
VQGQTGTLAVICAGPLPDNLAEALEVVVEGRLDAGGMVRGDKVLTRCASKYEARAGGDAAQRPIGAGAKGGP